MAAMRRVLTYLMVWGGATALAILLVWFAARPVLRGAVFGEPSIRRTVSDTPSAAPRVPTPTRSPGGSTAVATVSPAPSSRATPVAHDHTYTSRGGRVVLALTSTSARLVSATPNPGYEVRALHGSGWLRVDFIGWAFASVSGVVATWNGHAPNVVVNY